MQLAKAFLAVLVILPLAETAVLSPVTRVVELLEDLSKKTEAQGKIEEDLYETFVCWGKKVVDEKTTSNEAARKRSEELRQFIDDIESGRIEFTSERKDLEKDMASVTAAIAEATSMRTKGEADFDQADKEMNQAVDALDKAIEVLGSATGGRLRGAALIQSEESYELRASEAHSLETAISIGDKFLSKGDAYFLRRLLGTESPKRANWKKLNRKASFKMTYKARSGKIQDLIKGLRDTFKASISDAKAKEDRAQEEFDGLMEAKNAEKTATEEALKSMTKEMGSRGLNKEEAGEEADNLDEQVKNDEKYIKQVQGSLDEKKEAWKDRQVLRAGELEAISKAISILHSDDARDTMKKSLDSQEGFFLQISSAESGRAAAAAKVLRKTRLSKLAGLLRSSDGKSGFHKVLEAIDGMIVTLESEGQTDLDLKERCEKESSAAQRNAALHSRKADAATDEIAKLEGDIQGIESELHENAEAQVENQQQLNEANRTRQDEHISWQHTHADDTAAIALVKKASETLSSFYKDNNLMFVQSQQRKPSEAGKAPPPPPSTWDAPYGGNTEESQGIIQILSMISEDMEKDRAKAKSEELNAAKDFLELEAKSETQRRELEGAATGLEDSKGEKEGKVSELKTIRITDKENLGAVMKALADMKPGCDYISVNFDVRRKNRQTEADGLRTAKTILQGGDF